jgi:ATP-dependent phosphofructokinase / diphosphate-dependent phosphofructokinase
MVALRPFDARPATFLLPLEQVARKERRFPSEWMNPDRNDVTAAFIDWARPLVGDIPPHVHF